ncbi:hypothetical protein Nepgr_013758 [Nepenthes gracilis]|uniref:Uncharacterized protein n=1 Tax=Nepenthes gracilis TaxID=150966 RepID=A0AAD3SIY2_NEPGR|nr:hypothetical protein Nepgr_013758 [Nepenthes gracilis]
MGEGGKSGEMVPVVVGGLWTKLHPCEMFQRRRRHTVRTRNAENTLCIRSPKKGKDSLAAQGKCRYDWKQSGYGA